MTYTLLVSGTKPTNIQVSELMLVLFMDNGNFTLVKQNLSSIDAKKIETNAHTDIAVDKSLANIDQKVSFCAQSWFASTSEICSKVKELNPIHWLAIVRFLAIFQRGFWVLLLLPLLCTFGKHV